jgi:AAA+ ATPase superfamily predicted ATPase
MEQALEYFAVFGGMEGKIPMELPLEAAIEAAILDNYTALHREIAARTGGDSDCHALLSGAALGDRRTHSAFKRARLSKEAGDKAVTAMREAGLITREKARPNTFSWLEDDVISDRLHFSAPFLRFWFAFVSPIFKGIREGEYGEFRERYANHAQGFAERVFEALAMELLKAEFSEDPIRTIGGYWDKNVEIDIVAETASGKTVAASCRYVNAKLKKSELAKLEGQCERAGFEPDIFVLVAKNGFSGELRSLRGESLRLYTLKHFKKLLQE